MRALVTMEAATETTATRPTMWLVRAVGGRVLEEAAPLSKMQGPPEEEEAGPLVAKGAREASASAWMARTTAQGASSHHPQPLGAEEARRTSRGRGRTASLLTVPTPMIPPLVTGLLIEA